MTKVEHPELNILLINKPGDARTRTLEQFKSMLLNNEDLSPANIETNFEQADLIIIEGDHSLQNSAIVEASYAEIFFCDQFNDQELNKAVEDFNNRKRNFGS
jgi:undecaprenyl pyrophosphate synthase